MVMDLLVPREAPETKNVQITKCSVKFSVGLAMYQTPWCSSNSEKLYL